jgi:hypothetical protein
LQANLHVRIRLSSKPYKHTVRRKSGQPAERTGFPDVFHIGKDWGSGGCGEPPDPKSRFLTIRQFGMTKASGAWRSKTARNSMGPSAWIK